MESTMLKMAEELDEVVDGERGTEYLVDLANSMLPDEFKTGGNSGSGGLPN
jgi:hypothetical protein